MTTKRAYKLQEFVAHTSSVNCLKIGRKSSRVLVTGGEDHKVNLWAIGKPNAILSLSGHTSGIDSVSFDSAEVLVAAGAANGTIKLWDLEEAKIVRTLTGHRSNCISVDFHPFGEFFALGSLDTNLKIWDIRKKGCIHTYKGHTRGVSAVRFTPDGRWVVSGGEDNTVKVYNGPEGFVFIEEGSYKLLIEPLLEEQENPPEEGEIGTIEEGEPSSASPASEVPSNVKVQPSNGAERGVVQDANVLCATGYPPKPPGFIHLKDSQTPTEDDKLDDGMSEARQRMKMKTRSMFLR